MKIAIKNVDKTPMWSVPGTRIFLTYENPGPLEVDIAPLSREQKKVLALAHSRGVIVVDEPSVLYASVSPENLPASAGGVTVAKSYASSRVIPLKPRIIEDTPPATTQVQTHIEFDPLEERKKQLTTFLSKPVGTIKKLLVEKTLSELRLLLDLEQEDKKRKSVIDSLNILISKHQKDVFESISKSEKMPVPANLLPKDLPSQYLENVGDVVESDLQDVTIKLGATDDK